MADSAQAAFENAASNHEAEVTACDYCNAIGHTACACTCATCTRYMAAAHAHRDAAPTRQQAAHPNVAASEAAPSGYGTNEAEDAARDFYVRIEAWVEGVEEYRPLPYQPAPIVPGETQQPAQATSLPLVSPVLHSVDAHATSLPPISPELHPIDAQPTHRTLPAGHLRTIPDNWVAEQDLTPGHRAARIAALRYEIEMHALDFQVYVAQNNLRRYLDQSRDPS